MTDRRGKKGCAAKLDVQQLEVTPRDMWLVVWCNALFEGKTLNQSRVAFTSKPREMRTEHSDADILGETCRPTSFFFYRVLGILWNCGRWD